jgi:hypothetical protein
VNGSVDRGHQGLAPDQDRAQYRGFVLLLVALATMGAVDFFSQPALGIATAAMALLWLIAIAVGSRTGRRLGFRALKSASVAASSHRATRPSQQSTA